MRIRHAVVEDAVEVAEVNAQSWKAAYKDIIPEEDLTRILASLSVETYWRTIIASTHSLHITLLAENEAGQIVGYATFGPERNHNREYKGELYTLYLLPEYCGKGYGRALLAEAARELKFQGMNSMLVWVLTNNAAGRGFYNHMGGMLLQEGVFEICECSFATVAYGWRDVSCLLPRSQDVRKDKRKFSIDGLLSKRKKGRLTWRRWLLWSTTRWMILLGVGVGIGTFQWRAHRLDLMARAHRLASLKDMMGYYWAPDGELRLYKHNTAGSVVTLRWDAVTQSAKYAEQLSNLPSRSVHDPMREARMHVTHTRWIDRNTTVLEVVSSTNTQRNKASNISPVSFRIKNVFDGYWRVNDVVLSADKRRIAYICEITHQEWRDRIRQRIQPNFRVPALRQGAVLMVSRLDGSNTEVIGTVAEIRPRQNSRYCSSSTNFAMQGVFWSPDEKHLSFVYGDGVYEVAAK